MKKQLVVLTGAGISAESGLKTFRNSDGLWEGYNVMEVATPDAWQRHPNLVQQFYNERRKQVLNAQPNQAHFALAKLEKNYNVAIITQNIDDLHERAGSTNITHLHGIITHSQSEWDSSLIYPIKGDELKMGELCEFGWQLRPHVVWFGEDVPMIAQAIEICKQADVFILIGTSLAVYPAAGLLDYIADDVVKYIIDPEIPTVNHYKNVIKIEKLATAGIEEVCQRLESNA